MGVTDEIKAKLDVADVIGEYVQLKQAGTSLKACCPFHHEKSPSFFVSKEKQIWHCFGCGEGGDIFGFVMRMEGLEFVEALRLLAKKAGVVLRKEDAGASSEKQRLAEINLWAAKYFHEVLRKSPQAQAARSYLAKRKVADETAEDFLLGYAPESWDATSIFLRKRGYKDEDIFKAGLSLKSERQPGRYYDRFRNRLMFPIKDQYGNVVGFTGRVMPLADGSDPKEAKYVNTPQTPVYNKSAVLYGLNLAKQEIKRKGLAVVVEGNMDVIASHQARIANVVASSGTALTREQLDLLKRFSNKVVLSFDADLAGENAARRGIDAAVAAGFAVRVLRLPPGAGKDPDDCIKKDPAIWTKAIAEARPFMEWYIELARARTDFSDPDAKKTAAHQLLVEAAKFIDPVEASHWIRVLAEMFQTPESLLFEKLQKLKPVAGAAQAPSAPQKAPAAPESRSSLISQFFLAIVVSWPEMADFSLSGMADDEFEPEWQGLYKDYRTYYNDRRNGASDASTFRAWLERRGHTDLAAKVAVLELRAEKEFGDLPPEGRKEALAKLCGEIKKLHAERRKKDLMAAMALAEQRGDRQTIEELGREITQLMS